MKEVDVHIGKSDNDSFNNQVDYCIGTGRMGLALHKEYQDQLSLVQEQIGYKYIRGHGLFSDDMSIFHSREENGILYEEYNFTYLDQVFDNYLNKGIKPFLELGFMPSKMASGEQTIFYWKGNVTPPSDYKKWTDMIVSTLNHLRDRYGEEEIRTWPIEVWNEPNLPGFWKDANMDEYFILFKKTFNAIKEFDSKLMVGGPAICGVDDVRWLKCFMDFIHKHELKIDFVSRHFYTTENPDFSGHYAYQELRDPIECLKELRVSREIIDSYPEYKGLKMHITEFNTSYVPNNPLHDTNQNAAYIACLLSRMGDDNESYSYWTFGDVFEEFGVPFSPFHGGFGLVANGGILKPTFWTFKFFKCLKDSISTARRTRNSITSRTKDGFKGILWNDSMVRTGDALRMKLTFDIEDGEFFLLTKKVGEDSTNPLKVWHDMGEPRSLSKSEVSLLKEASLPRVETNIINSVNNVLTLEYTLQEFDVVYFEISRRTFHGDIGYDYQRSIMKQ